jgi:hypothetical protein
VSEEAPWSNQYVLSAVSPSEELTIRLLRM